MSDYWVLASPTGTEGALKMGTMHIVIVPDGESLDEVLAAKGIRRMSSGRLSRFEDHRSFAQKRRRLGGEHLTNACLRRLGDIPYRLIKYFAMSCPHTLPAYKRWVAVPRLPENMSVRKCHTLWLVRTRDGKKLYRVSQSMVQQLWALRLDNMSHIEWRLGYPDRLGIGANQLLERERGYAYFNRIPDLDLKGKRQIKIDRGLNFRGTYCRGWECWYRVCDLNAIAQKNKIKGRSKLKTISDYQQALLKL